jgi:hypothetical protein
MFLEKSGMRLVLVVTAMASWSAACTTVMYSGPRRSADEVAVLVTAGDETMIGNGGESSVSTSVAKIDDKEAKGSSFELLPGRHSVEVTGWKSGDLKAGAGSWALAVASPGAALIHNLAVGVANSEQSKPNVACFVAHPKHTYAVRTFGRDGFWVIEVFDQNTTEVVTSACPR